DVKKSKIGAPDLAGAPRRPGLPRRPGPHRRPAPPARPPQSEASAPNNMGGGVGPHLRSPGQRRKPDAANVPPSTCRVVPVIDLDRSEAKNSTASPRSSTGGGVTMGI